MNRTPSRTLPLPSGLARYLADSTITVVAWRAAESVLTLTIEKEIGPEDGTITLGGVSRVYLPSRLEISGMVWTNEGDVLADPIESDEFLLVIYGVSWEQPFFVVAKTIDYVATDGPIPRLPD